MARMANAVIGKKNETWCEYFMLAATLSGAVGLSAQMCGRPALALRAWRTWLPTGRPAATAGLRRAARA